MFPLRIYVNVMFLNLWPIASNTQDARTLKAAVGKTGKILGSASFQGWQRLPPWVMEEVEVAPTGGAFIVEGEHDRSAVPSSGSDHFWKRNYCNLMISQWFLLFNFGPFEFIWCVSRLRIHGKAKNGQPQSRAAAAEGTAVPNQDSQNMQLGEEWNRMQNDANMCILHTTIFINIHNWIIGYSILHYCHYCWFRVVV